MTGRQSARITVRIQSNAKRTEAVRFADGVLYVKIAAAPVRGKANAAVLVFLSDILGVSTSHLSIEKGATSWMKVIAIQGLSLDKVIERIGDYLR